MGQRANYIIKEADNFTVHYHHWRANTIASDLFLGEESFLAFVRDCKVEDEILEEPWIEGCVVIDIQNKELYFWSYEFARDTSVVNYYLQQLSPKWVNWELKILKNRMYDVERILGIDYISKQDYELTQKLSSEEIISDQVSDWVNTLVVVKNGEDLFVTQTGNLRAASLLGFGPEILPLILTKPTCSLPKEGENKASEFLVIDTQIKKLIVGDSTVGLLETFREFWKEYQWEMGDFGYIETLQLAGIDTSNLTLTPQEIKAQLKEMVKPEENFDPHALAKKLAMDSKDIQFNPNFFDDVKPQLPYITRWKRAFMKFFGSK